jgi:hypothetical protein
MDILKTPQEKLMEEAGMSPASPGWLNTPKQLLMQETGVVPRFADGGQVSVSPQDMLAELIVNNMAPEHFKSGGHSNLAREISAALRRKPFQSIFNALGFADVADQGIDTAKHLSQGKPVQAFESGFKAASAVPAALPSMPAAISMAVPYGGQVLSEGAATHMAQNPQFREQMMDMSSSPLGGALGGDAALAEQIMGDRDFLETLRSRQAPEQTPTEEPVAERRRSPLYQKTMVK